MINTTPALSEAILLITYFLVMFRPCCQSLFRIPAQILYIADNNVIALYWEGSLAYVVELFGIGFIMDLDHILGMMPLSKQILNR